VCGLAATQSARKGSDSGIVSPIGFAALRSTMGRNLVGTMMLPGVHLPALAEGCEALARVQCWTTLSSEGYKVQLGANPNDQARQLFSARSQEMA
jgi:hypothetical protein